MRQLRFGDRASKDYQEQLRPVEKAQEMERRRQGQIYRRPWNWEKDRLREQEAESWTDRRWKGLYKREEPGNFVCFVFNLSLKLFWLLSHTFKTNGFFTFSPALSQRVFRYFRWEVRKYFEVLATQSLVSLAWQLVSQWRWLDFSYLRYLTS